MNSLKINAAYGMLCQTAYCEQISTYGALKILEETGKGRHRDTLTISAEARQFSQESLIALIAEYEHVSADELTFYFENHNNMNALLDAINFNENRIPDGYASTYKDFEVIAFILNGKKQVIPHYAIPKMKAYSFPPVSAKDNTLILNNRSYYSYKTQSGRSYSLSVYDGRVERPFSETWMGTTIQRVEDIYDSREMGAVKSVLSGLAQGYSFWPSNYNDTAKEALNNVGITEGHFTIDAGKGTHHYILKESGYVENVDENLEYLNGHNWIEMGYQEGDIFRVYGNDYKVASDGHLHVSIEDGFTDTVIKFPVREEE